MNQYFTTKTSPQLDSRGFELDRLPGDIVSMPNNLEDIKINVNDFVLAETINYSLEKLYDNWLYLISYSYIGSNNIPDKKYAINMLTDTGTGPRWLNQTQYPAVSSTTKNTPNTFTDLTGFVKIDNIANSSNYNIIATTKTNVILLSGYGVTNIDVIQHPVTNVKSNNDITHPSTEILFKDITDLTVTDSNHLFVMDNELKSIFKFDISGITTLDEAILKNDTPGRLMIKLIGGPGEIDDKNKFKNNIAMCTNNNFLYVIDRDLDTTNVNVNQAAIKIYDSELNWVNTIDITNSINSAPIDITYNAELQRFYVLCHDWSSHDYPIGTPETTNISSELLELDTNFNVIKLHTLFDLTKLDPSIGNEKHKRVEFSVENSNIFYIVTEKNIYKKYISRPEKLVGRFKLQEKDIGPSTTNNLDFKAIDINSTTIIAADGTEKIKDEILIYDQYSNIIFELLEDGAFEEGLESQFDETSLDFDNIKIKSDEFVNAVVYNKSFVKTLYNNLLLLENISRRFSTVYTDKGLSEYVGFNYLREDELKTLTYETTLDNYIGINEVVLSATVNRCLERIYNLQLRIQQTLQENKLNVYPLVTQTIKLTI